MTLSSSSVQWIFVTLLAILVSLATTARASEDAVDSSANPQIQNAKVKTKANETPKLNIESFDWQGAIPSSRLVVIKNKYGSIRSRNHGDEQIFLHATFQEIGETPLRPEFEIYQKNDKTFIDVVYAEPVTDGNGQLRGRTDISILFPDTVSIYAETDGGLIKIDKTASHVEAVSQSGEINLTTTGLFSARSESGDIKLRLRGFKQHGQSSAYSVTGTIKADIFNDMAIRVNAQTAGKILLNDEVKSPGLVWEFGHNVLESLLYSQSGDIKIQIVAPPQLVQSEYPANVKAVDVDLRNLPKVSPWKPGDPIFEVNEKINHKKDNNNKNSHEKSLN